MNSISSNDQVTALRGLLKERFPDAHAARPIMDQRFTGVACLDAMGIPRGGICEMIGPSASAGAGLLVSGLLEACWRVEKPMALIDGSDGFDPQSVDAVMAEALLWVRCRTPLEAVKAADLLLRDGNLELMVMDLQLNAARSFSGVSKTVWYRLRSLAEDSGATLLVLTRKSQVPSACQRLTLGMAYDLESLNKDRAGLLESLTISRTNAS